MIRLHAYISSGAEGHYKQLAYAEGRYVIARLQCGDDGRAWQLVATRQPDGSVVVELVTDRPGGRGEFQTLAHLAEVPA